MTAIGGTRGACGMHNALHTTTPSHDYTVTLPGVWREMVCDGRCSILPLLTDTTLTVATVTAVTIVNPVTAVVPSDRCHHSDRVNDATTAQWSP